MAEEPEAQEVQEAVAQEEAPEEAAEGPALAVKEVAAAEEEADSIPASNSRTPS